ncbi:MAG: DNA recombination protein RmuC [Faecalibacterium sp.]|nr:DNA recombination protein RmuC [Ruminococcus sp.]MCM1392832.1 DNA recombination protein RmuC [Ruminococcus sp.]MCM1485696.1 DNA recombination protein RmuC [Faecalibacterium sp.]
MEKIIPYLTVISIIALFIISIMTLILMKKSNQNKDYDDILKHSEETERRISEKLTQLNSSVSEEFARNRMESSQSQSNLRRETTAMLDSMSKKIEKTAQDNYNFNVKALEAISQNLAQMRQGNEKQLEQIRNTVDEKLNETLTKRLNSSFQQVSDQLENVYKSLGEMKVLSGGVTQNVASLNRILTNVKSRGTWAEVQLEGLLNQTIPGMFDKNVMPNPRSRDIVEFAVKIPSNEDKNQITYLPIDSKFPVEDYIRLCDAADSGDTQGVETARKALEARIISQARDVKKYINEPNTTPFAIMYLATEGLYGEILSSRNGVAERCQNEFGVMIAGPSTITALLNSLSVGFRAFAINEKAKEVRTLLAAAKAQYDKFGALLEKAKKKIDEAGKSLDDAHNRNEQIQKKLRSVEEINQSEANELLGLTED